mgnify:CR=1 FL=1
MYYSDKAIIISRRDFREDDLLVNCFALNYGKIGLQVKGARKIKSKLNAHVDLFNLVELNWVAGKAGYKLIAVDEISAFKNIKNDYQRINQAGYVVNLFNKLTHLYHPDKNLFYFLKSVLEKIDSCQLKELPLVKLSFDYKLLFLLGYDPSQRNDLKAEEKQVIKKIIRLSVDEISKSNFKSQVLNNLYKKSKILLEEVLEKEVVRSW